MCLITPFSKSMLSYNSYSHLLDSEYITLNKSMRLNVLDHSVLLVDALSMPVLSNDHNLYSHLLDSKPQCSHIILIVTFWIASEYRHITLNEVRAINLFCWITQLLLLTYIP